MTQSTFDRGGLFQGAIANHTMSCAGLRSSTLPQPTQPAFVPISGFPSISDDQLATVHPTETVMRARFSSLLCAAMFLAFQAQATLSEIVDVGGTHALLHLPTGDSSRLPLVIIMPDAGAYDRRADKYITQLLGAGIATLESLEDGVGATLLTEAVMAHRRLDTGRIGVLGFGQGAREATALPGSFGVRALLYPGCRQMPVVTAARIVLLAHGAADEANPIEDCAAAAAAWRMTGMAVRHVAYAGATYAWDYPTYGAERHFGLPAAGVTPRLRVQAWPDLAELSASEVAGFFARGLAGEGP